MKFDALYSKIFEQDGMEARPEDVKVEPAPVPALPAPAASGAEGARTLMDYVTVLDHAIAALNGTDNDSLQRLLKSLDKPNTPFEGISEELWHEINRAAESISGVTTILKSYINLHSDDNSTTAPSTAPEGSLEAPSAAPAPSPAPKV